MALDITLQGDTATVSHLEFTACVDFYREIFICSDLHSDQEKEEIRSELARFVALNATFLNTTNTHYYEKKEKGHCGQGEGCGEGMTNGVVATVASTTATTGFLLLLLATRVLNRSA